MRIGIAISKDDPQIGGGLTYIQEILEAINRVLPETNHTFYLIGYEPEKPRHLGNIKLPWLTLHQAELLARPPSRDYEYYPDIAAANLDLICYLQPWMGEILDIPYISTIWDLQHRRQPFFPEVSLFNEFDRREEMYRRSLQRAAYIIAPNDVGKDEIVGFYQVAPERVRSIHHPTPAFALAPKPHPDEEGLFRRLGCKPAVPFLSGPNVAAQKPYPAFVDAEGPEGPVWARPTIGADGIGPKESAFSHRKNRAAASGSRKSSSVDL